jgi:hypothetical protein
VSLQIGDSIPARGGFPGGFAEKATPRHGGPAGGRTDDIKKLYHVINNMIKNNITSVPVPALEAGPVSRGVWSPRFVPGRLILTRLN